MIFSSPRPALCLGALIILLAAGGAVRADTPLPPPPAPAGGADALPITPLTILQNQTYALCAGAVSFVFDQLAYAKCQIKRGDSISLTLSYPPVHLPAQPLAIIAGPGNVQSVNTLGYDQGTFMVSTYSPPVKATTPGGSQALYSCTAGSAGSYAQCDGGICFKNSSGKTFPGLGAVASDEIVCSCPIATPGPSAQAGYQVVGPNPCLSDAQYNQLCNAAVHNGSTLYIGAPEGIYKALALKLNGRPANFNECPRSSAAATPWPLSP
jgi:hypothetical protein